MVGEIGEFRGGGTQFRLVVANNPETAMAAARRSTQQIEKLFHCQSSLPYYRAMCAYWDAFSFGDDDQPRRTALEHHRAVASFSTPRCVHESSLPECSNDLSGGS